MNRNHSLTAKLGILALSLTGCSLHSQPAGGTTVVQIPLPQGLSSSASISSGAVHSFAAPASVNDFNCFAVNVTGEGIPPSPACTSASPGRYIGVAAGAVPANVGAISVEVPNGKARVIQLIGMVSPNGCAPVGSGQNGRGYLVATATIDILGDVAVTMTPSFTLFGPQTLFDLGCSIAQQPSTFGLAEPGGVATDSSGNLFIADSHNDVIREVNRVTGVISTVAGTEGSAGYTGDGNAATSAQLNTPSSVAVDSLGNIYISDTNNQVIRKVTGSTGVITTVVGTGTGGYTGDGGLATAAKINSPNGIALDSSNNLYIADTFNSVIREVAVTTGYISTVAGSGSLGFSGDGSTATAAAMHFPMGVTLDSANNIYISDTGNSVVRKVSAGIINTVAGMGSFNGFSGNGGVATSAELSSPSSVAVDSSGNFYIADSGNNDIRFVNASTGIISTVAGTPGTPGYTGDNGPSTSATMNDPLSVVLDHSGGLFIADTNNSVIRQVGPDLVISTSQR